MEEKRQEMVKAAFRPIPTFATFRPIVKEKSIDEKLKDMTSSFVCTALDELVLDRTYEDMLRQYVENLRRKHFESEMTRQNELAMSWQVKKDVIKPKTKNVIFKYTRHVED